MERRVFLQRGLATTLAACTTFRPRQASSAELSGLSKELNSGQGAPVAGHPPQFIEPVGVYHYTFPLEDRNPGFQIALKNYADDLDPSAAPSFPERPEISIAAARGEYEPATFVVYATRNLSNFEIGLAEFEGKAKTIFPRRVEICRVVRTPVPTLFLLGNQAKKMIIGRFLPRWQPRDIPAGEFQEIWLTVHVPDDAPPGEYRGCIMVGQSGKQVSVPLKLTVYPFQLRKTPYKSLATYYRFSDKTPADEEQIRGDFHDMHEHNVRNLVIWSVAIHYTRDGNSFKPDYANVRQALRLARAAGITQTVVVNTGFIDLATKLGHKDLSWEGPGRAESGESLDGAGGAEFRRIAKLAMEGLLEVQKEFSEIRVVVTHMDEVLNNGRLPLYIRLTKAGQQVPGIKFSISLWTKSKAALAEIATYVNIPCYNGHMLEEWLGSGHTFDEMEQELTSWNQEAWLYHNVRGAFFKAEWTRILNGVYLWASPMRVHAAWIYQGLDGGNPFDQTDPHFRHHFSYSLPDPEHPGQHISTRMWECMREGGDDLRYLATLEESVSTREDSRPDQAKAAKAYLGKLRRIIRDAKLSGGPYPKGTPNEDPLLNALSERFSGEQWQAIRQEIVGHILALSQ
jgi:hypothetical protein